MAGFFKEIYVLFSLFVSTYIPVLGQDSYEKTLNNLYKYSVPQLTPKQLSDLLIEKDTVLILDTRTKEEYMVSHLEGAVFEDYDSFDAAEYEKANKNIPVVVYCSVGYRSERIGEKLQEKGFKEVYNLYGGIFEWKNQGNTVINPKKQPTDSVHTYNENWAKWLKNGIKIY